MGQEREKEIKPRVDRAGRGGGPATKQNHIYVQPGHHFPVCYFRKCCDRRVLFKDNQVTVSFPDANKAGLRFLSVALSDLSFFLGVKLASEPFT